MPNDKQKELLKKLLGSIMDIAEETEKDTDFNTFINELNIFNFEELELMEIIDILIDNIHKPQM